MPKTTTVCVRSTVFQVCQDELVTELLRSLPIKDWCDLDRVLWRAFESASKRLKDGNRHTKRKVELFFRHMVERLPEMSPTLAVAVGLQSALQLEVPDMGVDDDNQNADHCGSDVCRAPIGCFCECQSCLQALANANHPLVDILTDTPCTCHPDTGEPGTLPCPQHQGAADTQKLNDLWAKSSGDPPVVSLHAEMPVSLLNLGLTKEDDGDEFEHMLDEMPSFDDYEAVFAAWPYVHKMVDRSGKLVLALGYLSGRDDDDQLIRRNCEYNGKAFKYIQSSVGLLKKKLPNGTRLHIKVVPYHVGAKVRFWTNVAGSGDQDKYNRYLVCGGASLDELPTRAAFDSLHRGR